MINNEVFILAMLLFNSQLCWSNICDKGDLAFDKLQIHSAIKEYEKCLDNDAENAYLLEKLGDCHTILDQCEKAEQYYKRLVPSYKRYHPVMVKYAAALNCAGHYDIYQRYIDSLITVFPTKKEVLRLKYVEDAGESDQYFVQKAEFNSEASDYAPLIMDSKIIFTSNRTQGKKQDDFTGLGYSNVFSFDTTTKEVVPFFHFQKKFNLGTLCFYDNNTKAIVTANENTTRRDDTYLLKLFISEKKNGFWSEPAISKLNFINANNMHPTINTDASLLVFVSDVIPRYGTDMYYCTKNRQGDWSPPRRMVSKINSFGNEVFPVFIDEKTLVFSSDGLGSPVNGLDLYSIRWDLKSWTNPQPLAKPFNSSGDDFGIQTSDGFKTGFFTSNRENPDGSEDIFTFKKMPPTHADTISIIRATVPDVIVISGIIRSDSVTIADANVNVYDSQGLLLGQVTSAPDGTFIVTAKPLPIYVIAIEKEGFHIEYKSIARPTSQDDKEINMHINLTNIARNDIVLLENIYYDYNKYDILPSSADELEKLINMLLLNPNIKAEIASHTDAQGDDAYNMSLSKQRSQSVVQYLIDNGISPSRLIAKGYGETKIINHCKNGVSCTDEEHRVNRRTELKILAL